MKGGETQVYDADLSSYFDTIPHDKLFLAMRRRVTDGSVLALIRQWLKTTVVEPNGVKKNPRGKGTPQGGVISPLLSNVYLHWFETCAMLTAKATGQVMSIVRYADDFVILARKLKEDFVRKIESELEGRFGLVVNREKTKLLDMEADKSALSFLGYEFRYVRDPAGGAFYGAFRGTAHRDGGWRVGRLTSRHVNSNDVARPPRPCSKGGAPLPHRALATSCLAGVHPLVVIDYGIRHFGAMEDELDDVARVAGASGPCARSTGI